MALATSCSRAPGVASAPAPRGAGRRASPPSTRRSRPPRALGDGDYATPTSKKIFDEALTLMPGGVNSPVRAFKAVGEHPIVYDRMKGSHFWDVDGNEYVDYVGSWGPLIVGAGHPAVLEALHAQIEKGTSFGAPCAVENELAKEVIDRMPCVEIVRFVNSGTEACLSVARLMRAATGRDLIVKFSGCYHGHADTFLVNAGSGVLTLGLPNSPGVLESTASSTLTATYNDLGSVQRLFEANRGRIAGIIVEPIVGNSGFIPPQAGFLEGLREITSQEGALLCLDEVMTGFRVSRGGAQGRFGVLPDLTTMGKVIGGGLPVGAYGGRKDLMELVAPAGPMYQAGTLSGNPLAMVAGLETLKLLDDAAYKHLERITDRLASGLLAVARETGHEACGGNVGAMFGFFFCKGPVVDFESAKTADAAKFARFHAGLLNRGVYLAPSQFEAGFTSLAHTDADVDYTLEAARSVLSEIKP